ncbi:MAG: hypothetical protein IJR14_08365 [Synergistaceae bacterium]|nr:hypothetical protein [Synergistaceae bacterium]
MDRMKEERGEVVSHISSVHPIEGPEWAHRHDVSERPKIDWEEWDKRVRLEQAVRWAKQRMRLAFSWGGMIFASSYLFLFGSTSDPSRPYMHLTRPLSFVLWILLTVDGYQRYIRCKRELSFHMKVVEEIEKTSKAGA